MHTCDGCVYNSEIGCLREDYVQRELARMRAEKWARIISRLKRLLPWNWFRGGQMEWKNESKEKEFAFRGVLITRYDYESMPCPMCASELGDEVMQKIAMDTYYELCDQGWSYDQIEKWLGKGPDGPFDGDSEGDRIRSDFWRCMENAAIRNGMMYYEDKEDSADEAVGCRDMQDRER